MNGRIESVKYAPPRATTTSFTKLVSVVKTWDASSLPLLAL